MRFAIFLLFLFFHSCQSVDYGLEPMAYELTKILDTGSDILTEGNNPKDNIIYSPCNSFIYDYVVIKEGKEYLSKHVKKGASFDAFEDWEYVEKANISESTYNSHFIFFTPKYTEKEVAPNQSLIKVLWANSDSSLMMSASEGIIENHKNFWMHPLRQYHMWPTFTAPWPYVQFPVSVGDEYTWWKKLGGGWGSDRYVQWDKIIHFDYTYKVVDTEVLSVRDANIECFKIEATGTSEIGDTKVDFYFNPRLGFVKMDYALMDDSRIIMSMIDFELDCNKEFPLPEFKKEDEVEP